MAISKKDLFKVFLKPRDAYLLFLAKEETDVSLLPDPLTSEDKEIYDICIAFASEVAAREASATPSEPTNDGSDNTEGGSDNTEGSNE